VHEVLRILKEAELDPRALCLEVTENALIPLKERVADRKYDPLVWLGSKIRRRSS